MYCSSKHYDVNKNNDINISWGEKFFFEKILLCFFILFLVVFNSFFAMPVKIENARLKLALAIPTGAPITVANDAREMLAVVIDKTINELSK